MNGIYYLGKFEHTLDPKGRLFIPARFRDTIGDEFVIFKSPDRCIAIYDNENFSELVEQVRACTVTAEDRRKSRIFFDACLTVAKDKQGRFTMPKDFIEYANLETDVVIVGEANRLEVWSAEADKARRSCERELTAEDYPTIRY